MNKHPEWGYDTAKVCDVHCLYCNKPIGDQEFVEITILARFGQMLFAHEKCDQEAK